MNFPSFMNKRKKQLAILTRELAIIDINYRTNRELSRDATAAEIDKRMKDDDRNLARRAEELLTKLLGAESVDV